MTELAEYLRARREQLRPGDVGLPDNGRRRTPGLRHEEVATTAGVSIDYLVRLEQGRDLHPSPGVLSALAGALRLSDEERLHLYRLAAQSASPNLCPTDGELVRTVAPTLRALLERLDPTPAFVVGPSNDVLAWNPTWATLATPLGLLDGEPPNLARHVFLDPRASTVYPDWGAAADDQVSHLRTTVNRWGDDPGFAALMGELHAVAEFASRWSTHVVGERRRGVTRVAHPQLGELRIAYEVLLVPDDGEQRLITWLPANDATAAAFALADPGERPVSPARLRVVGEG